jgi:hypothetical protein
MAMYSLHDGDGLAGEVVEGVDPAACGGDEGAGVAVRADLTVDGRDALDRGSLAVGVDQHGRGDEPEVGLPCHQRGDDGNGRGRVLQLHVDPALVEHALLHPEEEHGVRGERDDVDGDVGPAPA